MTTHTPTPWIRDGEVIRNKRGQIIADCSVRDEEKKPIGGAERDANAELIIMACNSFTGLLMSLQGNLDAMKAALPHMHEDPEGADSKLYWAMESTEQVLKSLTQHNNK